MEKPTVWIVALSLFLFVSGAARAQQAADVPEPKLSPEQLDTLVGPIALYPDPMIAMILPASTVPSDIVLAARYLRDGKDANKIDDQNWDPSVKALARYPDVLNTMDENLEWTNQLGAAVIAQQEDVMAAIQTQRAKANALGNLQTTPQQQVIVEKEIITIVPADPQIIYVPQYNPQVVYVESAPPAAPFITFGLGLAMGAWLANDCDWHHHGFYVNTWGPGGWHGYNRYGYNGGGNSVNINNSNNININNGNNNNNYWKPNPNRPQPKPPYNPNRPGNGGANTLPTYRPPPAGGWNGGNNGGNRPGNGNGSGANRPGSGNGGKPTFPSNPGNGGGNNGNRPGSGGGNGANKPGNGGGLGGNKPAGGLGQTKPAQRPSQPQNKLPSAGGGGKNNLFDRENTKRERPAQAQRPAQQPARQQPRPAPQQQPQRQAPQAKPVAQRPQPQRQAGGGGLQR